MSFWGRGTAETRKIKRRENTARRKIASIEINKRIKGGKRKSDLNKEVKKD